jgi:hypothetical protein
MRAALAGPTTRVCLVGGPATAGRESLRSGVVMSTPEGEFLVGQGAKPWLKAWTASRTSASVRSALSAMAAAEPAPAAVMT